MKATVYFYHTVQGDSYFEVGESNPSLILSVSFLSAFCIIHFALCSALVEVTPAPPGSHNVDVLKVLLIFFVLFSGLARDCVARSVACLVFFEPRNVRNVFSK